jgi:hypothetical protein
LERCIEIVGTQALIEFFSYRSEPLEKILNFLLVHLVLSLRLGQLSIRVTPQTTHEPTPILQSAMQAKKPSCGPKSLSQKQHFRGFLGSLGLGSIVHLPGLACEYRSPVP